jgi:hypothetical protein
VNAPARLDGWTVHALDGEQLSHHASLADARRACDQHRGRACVVRHGSVTCWAPGVQQGDRQGALMFLRKLGAVGDASSPAPAPRPVLAPFLRPVPPEPEADDSDDPEPTHEPEETTPVLRSEKTAPKTDDSETGTPTARTCRTPDCDLPAAGDGRRKDFRGLCMRCRKRAQNAEYHAARTAKTKPRATKPAKVSRPRCGVDGCKRPPGQLRTNTQPWGAGMCRVHRKLEADRRRMAAKDAAKKAPERLATLPVVTAPAAPAPAAPSGDLAAALELLTRMARAVDQVGGLPRLEKIAEAIR